MSSNQSNKRIWELDYLRGIAILLMVFFHFIWDLNEFYQLPLRYENGWVYYIGKAAASLFIFIAGISCSLSKNNSKRGLKLIFWGLVITFTTSIAVPGTNIFFGILHFLGVSILLYPLCSRLRPGILLTLGTLIISLGFYLETVTIVSTNLLAPLGLIGEGFYSADYYPLVPWFGLFLYGVASGKLVYPNKQSLFSHNLDQSMLVAAGRHSLLIYLIHQPLLLLILFLGHKALLILK